MVNIFDAVDNFFASLQGFDINRNICFIVFVGLFLLTVLITIIAASKSYEAKLTKAIDMLNNYFMQNPNINEENLLQFNNKMKGNKIPKQLRKQWQQFVLYREAKASEYMSFENCVTKPGKNSSYKRCITVMNILAYIFAVCSLVLNLYLSYTSENIVMVLQKASLAPAIILLLNYIITIFLNFRHNAITSDLHQNYQYFEVNIDKATKTLPEYVDYEVLFDRNEIKRGIPILYSYLQRRAEEEQRELELARLKNVEHEKFNFDGAGIAASLVLERAMQEAENYIAERKKYNQDTEQINSDITQEDMNFREITKEYNRQMQVSKETFTNFKNQLEDASSSIEANYIKKQQQQELDRQRNLERDFDTASERHKKIIEGFNADLDSVDKLRAQSRKTLEDAMMSEFSTYSSKVYDEAKKVVEEREKEKYAKVKQQIRDLEEKLILKQQELENVYSQNQSLSDKLGEMGVSTASIMTPMEMSSTITSNYETEQEEEPVREYKPMVYEPAAEEPVREYKPLVYEPENKDDDSEQPEDSGMQVAELNETQSNEEEFDEFSDFEESEETEDQAATFDNETWDNQENADDFEEYNSDDWDEFNDESLDDEFDWDDEETDLEEFEPVEQAKAENLLNDDEWEVVNDTVETNNLSNKVEVANKAEQPKISTNQNESEMSGVAKRKAGRPRKVVSEEDLQPKRKPGRPRKEKVEVANNNKRKPGRPRKEESPVLEPKRKAGRPKKEASTEPKPIKKGRGRPKKVTNSNATAKRSVGRPKSTEVKSSPVKKQGRGRPRKVQENEVMVKKSNAGRPRKLPQEQFKNIEDIDAYLKEIDNVIAQENAKFEASKMALENKTNLKKRK